jgi:hypothetical protein
LADQGRILSQKASKTEITSGLIDIGGRAPVSESARHATVFCCDLLPPEIYFENLVPLVTVFLAVSAERGIVGVKNGNYTVFSQVGGAFAGFPGKCHFSVKEYILWNINKL